MNAVFKTSIQRRAVKDQEIVQDSISNLHILAFGQTS